LLFLQANTDYFGDQMKSAAMQRARQIASGDAGGDAAADSEDDDAEGDDGDAAADGDADMQNAEEAAEEPPAAEDQPAAATDGEAAAAADPAESKEGEPADEAAAAADAAGDDDQGEEGEDEEEGEGDGDDEDDGEDVGSEEAEEGAAAAAAEGQEEAPEMTGGHCTAGCLCVWRCQGSLLLLLLLRVVDWVAVMRHGREQQQADKKSDQNWRCTVHVLARCCVVLFAALKCKLQGVLSMHCVWGSSYVGYARAGCGWPGRCWRWLASSSACCSHALCNPILHTCQLLPLPCRMIAFHYITSHVQQELESQIAFLLAPACFSHTHTRNDKLTLASPGESDDMALAWEMLEMARLIYGSEAHSGRTAYAAPLQPTFCIYADCCRCCAKG
jgi:hypothetical protein